MRAFIAQQNIEHFLKLLEHERDSAQRKLLEVMLVEEQEKLRGARQQAVLGVRDPGSEMPSRSLSRPSVPLKP